MSEQYDTTGEAIAPGRLPDGSASAEPSHDARLEDWLLLENHLGLRFVLGTIHDDRAARFEDGARMHTSRLPGGGAGLRERVVVRTLNTRYLLGRPASGPTPDETVVLPLLHYAVVTPETIN